MLNVRVCGYEMNGYRAVIVMRECVFRVGPIVTFLASSAEGVETPQTRKFIHVLNSICEEDFISVA